MASDSSIKPDDQTPLCVDLDGTLINTDMLFESLVRLIRRNPLYFFSVFAWWARGRAQLKAEIARRVSVDATTLPYNQAMIDFIRIEKMRGRKVLLVTASDTVMADGVAKHLRIFDEVLASDGTRNLRGKNKGATLAGLFGERGFDYAGNSPVDLPVWERSRKAIVVNGSPELKRRAEQCTEVRAFLPSTSRLFPEVVRALFPGSDQPRERASWRDTIYKPSWPQNLLVFIPLVYVGMDAHRTYLAALAFAAFLLSTPGATVLSELFNIELDRRDPARKLRPFASGTLNIHVGLILGSLLVAAGFAAGSPLGWAFEGALAGFVTLGLPRQTGGWRGVVWVGLTVARLLGGYLAVR